MESIGRLLRKGYYLICSETTRFIVVLLSLVQKLPKLPIISRITLDEQNVACLHPSEPKNQCVTFQECLTQLESLSIDCDDGTPRYNLILLSRLVSKAHNLVNLNKTYFCAGCTKPCVSLTEMKRVVELTVKVLSKVLIQVTTNPSACVQDAEGPGIVDFLATITRLKLNMVEYPLIYFDHAYEEDISYQMNLANFEESAGDLEKDVVAQLDEIFGKILVEADSRNLISKEDWDDWYTVEYDGRVDPAKEKTRFYKAARFYGILCSSLGNLEINSRSNQNSREL